MRSSPTVTVLTTVRDGAGLLPLTIDSIRRQTFTDWEYVIVDDASTGGTVDVVERYARLDPRIRLVGRSESGGPYVAANTGLEVARGSYVARIDADDIACPDRLKLQVGSMRADPSLAACLGGWSYMDLDGRVDPRALSMVCTERRALKWSLCVTAGAVHSTAIVDRNSLLELGGYEAMPTSADLALWCAFARRDRLGVLPQTLVHYRLHPAQITSARRGEQRRWGTLAVLRHLEEMTGQPWDEDEARALRATGRWEKAPFDLGSRALLRWERLWSADRGLRELDRRALAKLTALVRLRHLRANRDGLRDVVTTAFALMRSRHLPVLGARG